MLSKVKKAQVVAGSKKARDLADRLLMFMAEQDEDECICLPAIGLLLGTMIGAKASDPVCLAEGVGVSTVLISVRAAEIFMHNDDDEELTAL